MWSRNYFYYNFESPVIVAVLFQADQASCARVGRALEGFLNISWELVNDLLLIYWCLLVGPMSLTCKRNPRVGKIDGISSERDIPIFKSTLRMRILKK